jgi:hypothetical protein
MRSLRTLSVHADARGHRRNGWCPLSSKRQEGSRGSIEPVSGKAGEYLASHHQPLARAHDGIRSNQHSWSKPDEKCVQGTAVPRYITQAMINAATVSAMSSGMGVLVGGVINRMVLGSGGHGGVVVSVIKGHDSGELSDHEQADRNRNDSPKAPKPLHR